MLTCKRCGKEHPETCFYPTSGSPTGRNKWCRFCLIKATKLSQKKHLNKRLWYGAKHRAAKQGAAFDLRVEDVVIPTHCPALGIPMRDHIGEERGHADSPSIDRLDPNRGYIRDNIAVISRLANAIKQNATPDQIIAVGLWAAKELKRRGRK